MAGGGALDARVRLRGHDRPRKPSCAIVHDWPYTWAGPERGPDRTLARGCHATLGLGPGRATMVPVRDTFGSASLPHDFGAFRLLRDDAAPARVVAALRAAGRATRSETA